MTSSRNSNQLLRVSVTPVRNRKPKTQPLSGRKAYADKLLDLLHDENIIHIQDSEIFVSVLAQAAQDLYKV